MACDERGSTELNNLVKYEHPTQVTVKSRHSILGHPGFVKKPALREHSTVPWSVGAICLHVLSQYEPIDILNIILPPKEWQKDGQKWRQWVSSVPATRADVIHLMQLLDLKMKQRRGRETGICPVRRDLYSQCFDELIREITIICAERGVLLLRIRDEIKLTMSAYESLYISATAYGMRKLLFTELMKIELQAKLDQLVHEKEELEAAKVRLKNEMETIKREHAVLERKDQESRISEMENLKKINQQLKKQMEACMGFKKRAAVAKTED